MGIAIALAANEYGADVHLVLGPADQTVNTPGIEVSNVITAVEMHQECIRLFPQCDVAILAAAVSDYTPSEVSSEKIKKSGKELVIRLRQTPDIAAEIGTMKRGSQIVAGFALETENEIENALYKLQKKNMDMIVLNSLRDPGAGFGFTTNKITIIDRNNNIDKFELKSKDEAARDILDKIVSLLKKKN